MKRKCRASEKMTDTEQAELAELRRCFQFLCDKFSWLLEFRRVIARKSDSLKPVSGPEPVMELAQHLLCSTRDTLEMQLHYIEEDGRAMDKVALVSTPLKEFMQQLRRFKDFDDVVEFLDGYAAIHRADVEGGQWDRQMLALLLDLKEKLTSPDWLVVNSCMVDPTEPRLDGKRYAKVLSGPLPQFKSLEELKLKLAVRDVRIETIFGDKDMEEQR